MTWWAGRVLPAIANTSCRTRRSSTLKTMCWQCKFLRSSSSRLWHVLPKLYNQPRTQFSSALPLWTTEQAPKRAKVNFKHAQFSFSGIKEKVPCFFDKKFGNGCTAVGFQSTKQKEGTWRDFTTTRLNTEREEKWKNHPGSKEKECWEQKKNRSERRAICNRNTRTNRK